MKYIKLFENFEGDDKQKELADELAAYFGVNLDTFAETSKIMAMSPEGIQRWFDAEMDKEEPNMPVIEELVRLGYEFDLLKKNLHYAALHDKVGLAKLLLDRGADYEARDGWLWTPLHWAARNNSRAVAELLLDRGAKIEARDEEQRTPLHKAAEDDSQAVAKLLLDRGAKIEARDEDQRTPLHMAAMEDSIAVAELLLDRGADKDARDGDDETPWDLAGEEIQKALPQLNTNYTES